MNLQSHTIGEVTILELKGRFDAYTAHAVQEWLERTILAGTSRLIVNLSQVNFIDSTGLATLVQGMKRCRQAEGDLRLSSLQQPVRMIFEMTRLDKAFDIFINDEQATQRW